MELKEIEGAYLRLKSFIYYDSSSLNIRKKIAEFEKSEASLKIKLNNLCKAVGQGDVSANYWKKLFNKINYSLAVKTFSKEEDIDDQIIHSQFKNKNFKSEREVYFAEIPIELQIVATLFVKLFGCKIERSLSNTPYGNKLDSFEHFDGISISSGLKLYEPYFKKYQDWRNNAVNAVKNLNERGKNSILVSMDLQDFYHSSRVDFDKLEGVLSEHFEFNDFDFRELEYEPEDKFVFSVLKEIHLRYMECCNLKVDDNKFLLPIGLISSGVIANWYLDPLDQAIQKELSPDYFGRYVDDILIVLPLKNGSKLPKKSELIDREFCDKNLLLKKDEGYQVSVEGLSCLNVQTKKFQIIHFVSDELTSLLDKYINDAKKKSSEYRLLPDEEAISADFDECAFNLEYSGEGRGLTEIKGFSDSKYGISGFLAKKLTLALQGENVDESEANSKLLRLFKGPMAIELYRLWEKLFTYFLISKDMKSFHKLHRQLIMAIEELVDANPYGKGNRLRAFYTDNFIMAMAMAYALKPSLFNNKAETNKLEKSLGRT
ncbi:MAG: hypothetical protein ACJAW8_001623 [Oleispira sp.]|jgi:hypothetical protein